jgi:hypothetical protein
MRIMLPTGRRIQCFFTGGGGSASKEDVGAGFSSRRVILSAENAGRGVLGFSSTASLGCVVL